MILIIDTNIVFSGLLKDSYIRNLLIDSPFSLYAPVIMMNEIRKYEDLILQKSGLNKEDFEKLFSLLIGNITIVQEERYTAYIEKANSLIGHIHKGDIPFIALALAIPNDGIWTEDKDFLKQNRIKVWRTKDIVKLINSLS